MTLVEMRRAIVEKVEVMPEIELKRLYENLQEEGDKLEILPFLEDILREDANLLKRLAQ